MSNNIKKSHLALQGGGAHGAFTWGVLDYILEDGRISIDSICATSAGTMNAVMCAYGYLQGENEGARKLLEEFWKRVSKSSGPQLSFLPSWMDRMIRKANFSLFDTMTHIASPYQFNPDNHNILRDIIEDLVDFNILHKTKHMNLFISATNVRTGQVRIFNNEEINIDVMMASSCLPYLFQAVNVEDQYYWDGGYMGNPPIFPLFYHDSPTTDVIIVHINPITRHHVPKTASEILNRINEITFNSSLVKEFRAIAFVQKLIDEDWLKDEHKNKVRSMLVHSVRADEALHEYDVSTKFDVDWQFLTHLRDLGRLKAKEWLDKHFVDIGNKSTVDLHETFLNTR